MNLHLHVTHAQSLLGLDAPLPALQKLLAVGHHSGEEIALDHYLCAQLQVPAIKRQATITYPIAALSWLGDSASTADDVVHLNILRADPVHLVLQRDSFSLTDPVPLMLKSAEANALLVTLNQHFAEDKMHFCLGESGRWYLHASQSLNIQTSLPEVAMYRNIDAYLPQGADAKKCNQFMNELQMLMFTHPVNASRELNRSLPVNSLWLSGEGELPARWQVPRQVVFANHPLLHGIAKLTGLEVHATTTDFDKLMQPNCDQVLACIHDTSEMKAEFFHAALNALKARKIRRLYLYFWMGYRVHSVEVNPLDLLKFWRPLKSFSHYIKFDANTTYI